MNKSFTTSSQYSKNALHMEGIFYDRTKTRHRKMDLRMLPLGNSGRSVRKLFATKGEALAFERYQMDETEAKPWLGETVDRRTLKDVIEL
jgi:hypothetical protein